MTFRRPGILHPAVKQGQNVLGVFRGGRPIFESTQVNGAESALFFTTARDYFGNFGATTRIAATDKLRLVINTNTRHAIVSLATYVRFNFRPRHFFRASRRNFFIRFISSLSGSPRYI